MSDYKELLERLKCNGKARISCQSLIKYSICAACADAAELDAATAIETLLAERDVLLYYCRGDCAICQYGGIDSNEHPCSSCSWSLNGEKDHWEWSGIGGKDGT